MNIRQLIGIATLGILTSSGYAQPIPAPPQEDYTVGSPILVSMYWAALQSSGAIEQIPTNQHGELTICEGDTPPGSPRYPRDTTVRVKPETDPDISYRYTIRKESPESPWEMIKAQKTDADGNILDESLPIPSADAQKAANEELNSMPSVQRYKKE